MIQPYSGDAGDTQGITRITMEFQFATVTFNCSNILFEFFFSYLLRFDKKNIQKQSPGDVLSKRMFCLH